jgi:IK cytokine
VDDAAYEDELEAVFAGKGPDSTTLAEPEPTESKTRSDILAKLKASRAAASSTTEAGADTASKFKPIGFKAVGGGDVKKKKKRAEGAPEGERKKKKLKAAVVLPEEPEPLKASTSKVISAPTLEPPADEELDDIFAGVDDYQGVDFGDSDDEVGERPDNVERISQEVEEGGRKRGWFDDEPSPTPTAALPEIREPAEEGEEIEVLQEDKGAVEEDPSEAIKLRPLASSSIPSVRDILAADDAIALEEKRKARREKRKKARD